MVLVNSPFSGFTSWFSYRNATKETKTPVKDHFQNKDPNFSLDESLTSLQKKLPPIVIEEINNPTADQIRKKDLLKSRISNEKQKIINKTNLSTTIFLTLKYASIACETQELFELVNKLIPNQQENAVNINTLEVWKTLSNFSSHSIKNEFKKTRNIPESQDLTLTQKVQLSWTTHYKTVLAGLFFLFLVPGLNKIIDKALLLLLDKVATQWKCSHAECFKESKLLLKKFLIEYAEIEKNNHASLILYSGSPIDNLNSIDPNKIQIHKAFRYLLNENETLDSFIFQVIHHVKNEFPVREILKTLFSELRISPSKIQSFIGYCLYPLQWILCSSFIVNWLEKFMDTLFTNYIPLYYKEISNDDWCQTELVNPASNYYTLKKTLSYFLHPLKNIELLFSPQNYNKVYKKELMEFCYAKLGFIFEKPEIFQDAKNWEFSDAPQMENSNIPYLSERLRNWEKISATI